MQSPKFPIDERQRLNAVKSYHILDTLPERDYDNITNLVANICNVPISLITVLDKERNFFKSHHGIPFNESPRNISFCGHAILQKKIMIVEDSRIDNRFANNPLVTNLEAIFYAGVPLIDTDGFALGTICVFDQRPRKLNDNQIEALKTLGKQVVNLFELRKKNTILEKAKLELENRNLLLKSFASHVSHDLKSPLSNISSLTDVLRNDNQGNLSKESVEYLNYIEESTSILRDYIDGILMHYKSDELLKLHKENINFTELAENIKHILISEGDEFVFPEGIIIKDINKSALLQILINLVDNALKYNHSLKRKITLTYETSDAYHKFAVSDNGLGISKDKQKLVFEIFKTVKNDHGKSGTGIGLSTVKNLVEKLGGSITVHSQEGQGSTFTFTIAHHNHYLEVNTTENTVDNVNTTQR